MHKILENPKRALDYMERLINDGSKSGATEEHNTSKETNPFFSEGYKVKKIWANRDNIEEYGELPEFCISKEEKLNYVYIHPDWLLKDNVPNGIIEDGEYVVPTSSARTVKILNLPIYLKLCYPGIIGRLERDLKYSHLISGIELTKILNEMKMNKDIPILFEFMPESGGKIFRDKENELGFLVRKIPENLKNYIIIPGFSLFSKDRNATSDPTILVQILKKKDDKKKYLLEMLIYPLIDIFFYCSFSEGIILEMHSQNVLFAFDENWDVKKIILRDLESADKDLSIREKVGKRIDFQSYPFKCRVKSDKDYYLRHSFMYDHKLGEYLLDPLIQCAGKSFNLDCKVLNSDIKKYVQCKYGDKIKEFFPSDNCWYKYPKGEIDRTSDERPFISENNPRYR